METCIPSVDRRQGQRKRLDTPVRILRPGYPDTLVGSTRNLSELGMFVRMDAPLSVGAELACDVCLPEPHQSLPVHGRVVWVQDKPEPGIGVELLELSEEDRTLLNRVIYDSNNHVKVWLDTLTHPILASVTPSEHGVVLSAPLPFLRLLSKVVVCPVDQPKAGFSGTLDAVTLRPGPSTVPELRFHLTCQPPQRPAPTCRVAVPITPVSQAAGEFVAQRHPTVKIEQEPTVVPAENHLLQIDEHPHSLESSGADAGDGAPGWTLPPVAPGARSHWTLSSDEVAAAVEARSGAQHLWLWLAAAAMVSVTLGSMVYTKSWSRAWNWTRTHMGSLPAAAPAHLTAPTIIPVAAPTQPIPAAPVREGDDPPAQRASRAKDLPRVQQGPLEPLTAPPVGVPPVRDKPHVVQIEGEQTLVVPINGSSKDVVHYRLANPDGLVVNLPNARPRARFGSYPLKEQPFRVIWLRRRSGGLHLRVLFSGKLPTYRLKILDNAVRVVLEPAQP